MQRMFYAIPKLLHDDSKADIDAKTVPCTGVIKSISWERIYSLHLTSLLWTHDVSNSVM